MTWIDSVFLWLYCLRIPAAVLLAAAVSLLFLLLDQQLGGRRGWKAAVICLLLIWLAALLWVTVWSRTPDDGTGESILIPFYSYYVVLTGGEPELLRSNFMNVLLFYPAGLFFGALLPGRWPLAKKLLCVAVIFAAMSAGIEFFQYFRQIGRAETDDVLHNSLGALLGCWAADRGKADRGKRSRSVR